MESIDALQPFITVGKYLYHVDCFERPKEMKALRVVTARIEVLEDWIAKHDLKNFERSITGDGPALIYEPALLPEDVERLKSGLADLAFLMTKFNLGGDWISDVEFQITAMHKILKMKKP